MLLECMVAEEINALQSGVKFTCAYDVTAEIPRGGIALQYCTHLRPPLLCHRHNLLPCFDINKSTHTFCV